MKDALALRHTRPEQEPGAASLEDINWVRPRPLAGRPAKPSPRVSVPPRRLVASLSSEKRRLEREVGPQQRETAKLWKKGTATHACRNPVPWGLSPPRAQGKEEIAVYLTCLRLPSPGPARTPTAREESRTCSALEKPVGETKPKKSQQALLSQSANVVRYARPRFKHWELTFRSQSARCRRDLCRAAGGQ